MKTIGLIGGMSWESSAEYYRIINQAVGAKLGGLHSAKCVLVSVDFAEIEELQNRGAWDEAARRMAAAAQSLEAAGADCVVLCTNTMHKLAEEIQVCSPHPLSAHRRRHRQKSRRRGCPQGRIARHALHHGREFLQRPPDERVRPQCDHSRSSGPRDRARGHLS